MLQYGNVKANELHLVSNNIIDTMANPTTFDGIMLGLIPSTIVYNDEMCEAIVDKNPQAPLHLIIFPKDKENCVHFCNLLPHQVPLLGHMMIVAAVSDSISIDSQLKC